MIVGMSLPAWSYDVHDNIFQHNREGVWQLQERTLIEAIAEFKAALALKPSTSIAASLYHNWGVSALAMRDYPAAFKAFQQACQLQPTYLIFRQDLAHAYALAGLLPQAQAALRDTLALNAKDGEAWLLLGLLYQEQDQINASQKSENEPIPGDMGQSTNKSTDDKKPVSVSSSLSAPGNVALTRTCFEQYLKLQPESEMARAVKRLLKEMPLDEPGSTMKPAELSMPSQTLPPEPLPAEGNKENTSKTEELKK